MRETGFADKTDVLLVGPFLAGSRLLIGRGVKLGLSAEIVGRITHSHPVPEV
jgi:hypothetical protein